MIINEFEGGRFVNSKITLKTFAAVPSGKQLMLTDVPSNVETMLMQVLQSLKSESPSFVK